MFQLKYSPSHSPQGMYLAIYVAVSVAIVGFIAKIYIHPAAVVTFERDIWHHVSVYRELIASPFYAVNPHVDTMDPSRSYSPWTMVIAMLTRLVGGDPYSAIWLSAIASTAVILSGVFLFAREYWQTTLAPLVLLLVVHATWLTKIKHAGYTTVGTAVYCIPYPYAPALGLGLCMWWLILRALKGNGNLWICACLTLVLTYTIFVTHQLQALFMVGFAFSLLLFFPSGASARAKLVLGSSLILGLLLTQWWWYMDPIAYILNPQVQAGHSGKRHLDFSFENWSTISRMVRAIGLASFGVLGFWSFREAKVRWELLLPFVVVFSGFLYLVVVGSWVDIRVMPFVVFLLQLGVVSFLLERQGNKFGKLIQGGVFLFVLAGFAVNVIWAQKEYERARTVLNGGQVERMPKTWTGTLLQDLEYATSLVPSDTVAITYSRAALPIESTTMSVVSIPRLFAEVPDMLERKTATEEFFSDYASVLRRCQILQQYGVGLIVWRDSEISEEIVAVLSGFGKVSESGQLRFVASQSHGFEDCPIDR